MLKQLSRTTNATKRIFDFVRQVADQFATRQLLLQQPLLTRRLQLLIDRPQLDQQPRPVGQRSFQGINRAIQLQQCVILPPHLDPLPGIAPPMTQCLGECFIQSGSTVHNRAQRRTQNTARTDGEQIFRRRVHVTQPQLGIKDEYRRRQQVESGKRGEPHRLSGTLPVPSGWLGHYARAGQPYP